jgi:hypothetical protein
MSTVTTTIEQAPFVDILGEQFRTDPDSVIEELRRGSWIARTHLGVLVIGRPQVQALLADRRLRSGIPEVLALQGVTDDHPAAAVNQSLLVLEGDDHTRIRRLTSRAFTPRAADRYRPTMQSIMKQLVAAVEDAGRCEFMTTVADHYPIQVMCHVLGVPREDHERFAQWNAAIAWALTGDPDHLADVEWGLVELGGYVADLIGERRRDPRDDMVTTLVQAVEADDRLTDEEILGLIVTLLFAGHDTTRNQLGNAMWLFAQHPDQWKQLHDRPELAATAVEEVLRLRGAGSVTARVALADIAIDGQVIPAGTFVTLSLAGANHDLDHYIDPFTLDVTATREPVSTFGAGAHYCLGASLARAELQEALTILAEAMPHLELDGAATWRSPLGIHGPDSLPLRFDNDAGARR